ncbi:MAG: hypothetical protein ABIU63_13060 [Chitinophagaceae bacterium]
MIKLGPDNLRFDGNGLPEFVAEVTQHKFGKKITLKEQYASGDYKLLEFNNGFFAYVSNYIVHDDFELELSSIKEDYVALHINQIQAGAEFEIALNQQPVSYDDKVINSIFLTAASDSVQIKGSSGACVNRLKIMVPKKWIAHQVPGFTPDLLHTYLGMSTERLYFDGMDNTYRSMVDKVMNTEDSALYLSVTQDIIAVITERFFNRLIIKLMKNQQGSEWNNRVA